MPVNFKGLGSKVLNNFCMVSNVNGVIVYSLLIGNTSQEVNHCIVRSRESVSVR